MGGGCHALVLVGYADRVPAARSVVRALQRAAIRVSVLCEPADAAALRDAPIDGALLVCALGDDPPWPSVRNAAGYASTQGVDVLVALGARAHVLGVLAGALCAVDCVALVREDQVPMLDLEAHRLGGRGHLVIERASALEHARLLGVAAERLHGMPGDGDATRPGDDLAALLRRLAARGAQPPRGG